MKKNKRFTRIMSLVLCLSMLCTMMLSGSVIGAAEETVEQTAAVAVNEVESMEYTSEYEAATDETEEKQEVDSVSEAADETEPSMESASSDETDVVVDAEVSEVSDADDEVIPDESDISNASEGVNPTEGETEAEMSDAEEILEIPTSSEQEGDSTESVVPNDEVILDTTVETDVSDSLVESELPDVTAEPDSTSEPEMSDSPEGSEIPDATMEPEITPVPGNIDPTQEPESSDTTPMPEQPDITPEPEITVEPEVTPAPEVTPQPDVPEYDYLIQIIPPLNWTKADSANALISVRDLNGLGWDKIEVRAGQAGWVDVTNRFMNTDEISFPVSENGTIVVRVIDPVGGHHEVQSVVSCFDREAPLLTAGIVDQSLQAVALDSLSGVAGIGVNELLFTTFDSGLLDVRLESRLKRYKQLKVYTYDHAGNVSQEVVLDNPYYVASVSPTKKPSSGGSGNTASKPTAVPTAVPTAAPMPVPEMTYTPGTAFQMDGNMQTLDLLFSSNTNKQFISVQTRNGETYYLVIDYDKPIDENGNLYETYFLNLVDDRDLMDVVSEEDYITPKPEIVYVTPEPTEVPVVDVPVDDDDTEGNGASGILALLMLAGIGGGALWYFKFRKEGRKKQTDNAFDEYDFDDEEESDEE